MGHDKLSDHYTTAKNYTDIDGQSKTFDIIDYDVKTSIGTNKLLSEDDRIKLLQALKEDRKKLIARIIGIPPSMCPPILKVYTIRGDIKQILWNEKMLSDPGMSMETLHSIYAMMSNVQDLHSKGLI